MTNPFDAALTVFVAATQAKLDAHYAGEPTPTLSVDPDGRKYVRVVSSGHGQRSVFAFVERSTGNVLKAEGWKKPAKHARGSVYVNAGQDAVHVYGVNYLNGPAAYKAKS